MQVRVLPLATVPQQARLNISRAEGRVEGRVEGRDKKNALTGNPSRGPRRPTV